MATVLFITNNYSTKFVEEKRGRTRRVLCFNIIFLLNAIPVSEAFSALAPFFPGATFVFLSSFLLFFFHFYQIFFFSLVCPHHTAP